MGQKALILGALPSPFEGPWIHLPEGSEWEVDMPEHVAKHVEIEVQNGGETEGVSGNGAVIKGDAARARLTTGIEDSQMKSVSVLLRRIS